MKHKCENLSYNEKARLYTKSLLLIEIYDPNAIVDELLRISLYKPTLKNRIAKRLHRIYKGEIKI